MKCKVCGESNKRAAVPGYRTVAPALRVCVECLNRFIDFARESGTMRSDTIYTRRGA